MERTLPERPIATVRTRSWLATLIGISVGLLNHALFGVTVFFLFRFLRGDPSPHNDHALALDVALGLQFAVIHSWLLWPSTRKRISRFLPSEFFGTLFCAVTCVCLLTTIGCWRTSSVVVIDLTGTARTVVERAFLATWGVLLYSLSLTGLGYQTGLTTWWAWVRQQPLPKRDFTPRGLYHVLRHPIYGSFLGLIWLTPTMTLDRLLLNVLWTSYIFFGSVLKDRRLEHFVGDRYRAYQTRVAGYPGIFWGPLAKRTRRQ